MAEKRQALIAVNLVGFMWFLMDDIDLLCNRGFDVVVTADNTFREDHTIAEIKRRGARFVEIPCEYASPFSQANLDCIRAYRRLFSEIDFDLIMCHTPIIGAIVRLCALGCRRRGAKVIYYSHGLSWNRLSDSRTRLKYRFVETVCSRLCDAVVTINDEDFRAVSAMHCPRVYKINGVGCDVERISTVVVDRAAKRREIGVAEDEILVMGIGRLIPLKNFAVIAEAIAMIAGNDKYHYVLCGSELSEEGVAGGIIEIARKAGVKVSFIGFRSDIPELVHCADIGVMPSLKEGLGLAGIEFLSAGVPVIGTAVQGIAEYVIDGQTGFAISDPFDASAFADAIIKLSDPELRRQLSASCVKMAWRFDRQQSIDARAEIIDEVLSGSICQ